jgi:hypothetical protein
LSGCKYTLKDIIYNTVNEPNTNEIEQEETEDVKFISFLPSEATSLNAEEFKTHFMQSEYSHDLAVEYKGFYNFMPEEYSKKYNLDVFEVIDHANKSKYYLWHDGIIYDIAANYGVEDDGKFKGVVHFAIVDMNRDDHFELLISWHKEDNASYSYISAFDSATNKLVKSFIWTPNNYYFFKNDKEKIAIYGSNDNYIDNATTLYSEVMANNKQFIFKQKEFAVTSTNFKAEIKIDENTINFPLIFKELSLKYSCNVVMTYIGETFSYDHNNGYLDGAFAEFKMQSGSINVVPWDVDDVESKFTVESGQVIDRTYYYYETLLETNSLGTYDMVVSYRGEYIIIDNVLEVVSK